VHQFGRADGVFRGIGADRLAVDSVSVGVNYKFN
jgi:hypothetical protein